MKTEQINIRLEPALVAALERVAREEALDRGTAIRRLLETSIRQWEVAHALEGYQRGQLSLGRAAEESGLSQWELLEAARSAGIAYPLRAEDVERRLQEMTAAGDESSFETLPDRPPKPGGVLLVGINPAPVSVAAGHYYQGRIGRRLWRRLEQVGLLDDPLPGAEDEAFARAGHGLTDLVKRPTASSSEVSDEELSAGADRLRAKVKDWTPGLILFAFKEPARRLLGDVKPGAGPPLEGVPTFLLSGPYAPREESERIDKELAQLVRDHKAENATDSERSQRVTTHDLSRGQLRFPRTAKRFFPSEPATLDVVLRGTRLTGTYDPRTGPDKERSAVLRIHRSTLSQLVNPNERLRITRAPGGVVRLD